MAEKREFVDENRDVMRDYFDMMEVYYDLLEKGGSGDVESLKLVEDKIWGLIEKDPDFLDPYILLYEVLKEEGNTQQAEELLDDAYERAVALITDENGDWPDTLEWARLENRHIIRTILNKAILLWESKDVEGALELFRKLVKTNPGDNIGARYFILAIKMGMSFDEFENRFNKGDNYDMEELMDWFEDNYKDFPEEFGCWEKVFVFKVDLKHRKKTHRIEIKGDQTLGDFDHYIRKAFNHDTDDHLSEFYLGEVWQSDGFGTIEPWGDGGVGAKKQISQLNLSEGDKLEHVYDFGDDIQHIITLEMIVEPDNKAKYPRIISKNTTKKHVKTQEKDNQFNLSQFEK